MKLVGIQKVSFEKDGKSYEGTRLYFEYESENVEGVATDTVYCNSSVDCSSLELGGNYEIRYNKYGKPVSVESVSA